MITASTVLCDSCILHVLQSIQLHRSWTIHACMQFSYWEKPLTTDPMYYVIFVTLDHKGSNQRRADTFT